MNTVQSIQLCPYLHILRYWKRDCWELHNFQSGTVSRNYNIVLALFTIAPSLWKGKRRGIRSTPSHSSTWFTHIIHIIPWVYQKLLKFLKLSDVLNFRTWVLSFADPRRAPVSCYNWRSALYAWAVDSSPRGRSPIAHPSLEQRYPGTWWHTYLR